MVAAPMGRAAMLYSSKRFPQNLVLRAPLDASRGSSSCFESSSKPGEPQAGGGSPPSVSRGDSLTPPEGKTREKFNEYRLNAVADQRRAASIYRHYRDKAIAEGVEPEALDDRSSPHKLPGRGVTMCGLTQISGMETEQWRQTTPDGRFLSYFTGLQPCGLRQVCPICTAAKSEKDRLAINDGLAAARRSGLVPVMVTMTLRHSKRDNAKELLDALCAAEQTLKQGKAWRRLKKRLAGYARVLEWTFGKRGHHPHYHMIVLVRAENEAQAIALVETLRDSYLGQLEAAGRDGSSKAARERAFHVQGASAVKRYMTKGGMAEEITGARHKDDSHGLTQWQLLRESRTAGTEKERGDHARTWWQIITAVSGRAQLYLSQGWRDLMAQEREAQDPEPVQPKELVASYGQRLRGGVSDAWSQAKAKRLALREAAEAQVPLDEAQKAVSEALRQGPSDSQIIRSMNEEAEVTLVEDLQDEAPLKQVNSPHDAVANMLARHKRRRGGDAASEQVDVPPQADFIRDEGAPGAQPPASLVIPSQAWVGPVPCAAVHSSPDAIQAPGRVGRQPPRRAKEGTSF